MVVWKHGDHIRNKWYINDKCIQTDLTYKKALEIAQAMEVAACDINDIQKQLQHTAMVHTNPKI